MKNKNNVPIGDPIGRLAKIRLNGKCMTIGQITK